MRSHLLSRHMQPTLSSDGTAASPSASPAYPDVCLLPNNAKASRGTRALPKPRHGFLPASLQHPIIEAFSSLKENEDDNENDIKMTMKQCVMTTNNPLLEVDCHFFSPPPNFGSQLSQPITPSPKSSTPLLDNSSGWKVPYVSLEKTSSSNELDSEGKRIGYDGTNQTPSIQLLKPTASSLGHRVHKAAAARSQQSLSPTNSMHDNPYRVDSPQEDSTRNNVHCFDHHKERGDHMTIMSFNTPASSSLDPFGKLNQSNNASNNTASDDEEMEEKTQTSSSLLDDFECYNGVPEGGMNYHPPVSKPVVLQRCASWSPGYGNNRGFEKGGRSCPERLRSSYNIDPVASQLLRECIVHEEEEAEQELDPMSTLSHAIGRISGLDEAGSCHSPIPPSNDGNFLFSASMPDLLSPIPPVMTYEQGRRNKDTPMIAEEASIDYPLSPEPLFRDVSGSLRDVQTEDDIKSFARPVPRKFSVPADAGSHRRFSLSARH